MRIEYDLKFRDYLLFNMLHQFSSGVLQAFCIGLSALIFSGELHTRGLLNAAIFALEMYAVMWLMQLLFNVIYLSLGNNRAFFTKHIVEIDGDSIYEETRFNKSYYYWPGIIRIVSRPGFVAIYIRANAALLIPDRAFTGSEQRSDFVSAVTASLNSIRS